MTSILAQVVQKVGGAEPETGGRGATTIPGGTSPTIPHRQGRLLPEQ
ncbi:MAG TPA: hypothetical protein VI027_08970 [Rubrobacteraceae bacterium]